MGEKKMVWIAVLMILTLVCVAEAFGAEECAPGVKITYSVVTGKVCADADMSGEFMGCVFLAADTGLELGCCGAQTADGQMVQCTTSDPILLKAIRSIGENKYVLFDVADDDETCEGIIVSDVPLD